MNIARIKIELINSEAGRCIAINDYRVAGPKPIHGVVVSEWSADQNDVLRAFLTPDQKHEWLSEELHVAPLSGSERYLKSELAHELKMNAALTRAVNRTVDRLHDLPRYLRDNEARVLGDIVGECLDELREAAREEGDQNAT